MRIIFCCSDDTRIRTNKDQAHKWTTVVLSTSQSHINIYGIIFLQININFL